MSFTNSELPSHRFQNIAIILQRANSRYIDIASRIRASLRPTFHARKRAAELRLGVDVGKAIRCDQRQVSIIPLPVLDFGISPTGTIAPVAPIIFNGDSNIKNRPVLRCAIPACAVIHRPCQVVSSASPCHSVTEDRPFPSRHLPSSPMDDSPVEATPIGDDEINASLFMHVNTEYTCLPSAHEMCPVDVPGDGRVSWDFSDTDVSSASSTGSRSGFTFPSSCSSSASDSTGPMTPDVYDEYPAMIRIKRKSANVAGVGTLEKRPKFERKEWLSPAVQRRNVVRIPSRR